MMVNKQDARKLLNVSDNASLAEIRVAYIKKALAFHPDKHPQATSEELENMWAKITM